MATLWDVSRQRLAEAGSAGQAATVLLEVCAFLGPEPIPLDLFTAHADLLPPPLDEAAADEFRFNQASSALIGYGLAAPGQEDDCPSLRIHRLLAAVVRTSAASGDTAEPARLRTAISLLAAAAPDEPRTNVAGWPAWARLIPHVRATLDLLPNGHANTDALCLGHLTATYLRGQGQLAPAITLIEQVTADHRRILNDDHPGTLASCNNLAMAYQDVGQLDKAIPLFEQTLTDSQRVLGDNHLYVLASRNNLAGAYYAAGQTDKAIRLFEQTLADCRRVLDAKHPLTAAVQENLNAAKGKRTKVDAGPEQKGSPPEQAPLKSRLRRRQRRG